jgi:hypothetical protein
MKALLVFPDPWFAYSPSAIQSAEWLQAAGYEVHVVALTSPEYQRVSLSFETRWVRVPRGRLGRRPGLKLWRLRNAVRRWATENGEPSLTIGFDAIGYLAAGEASPDPVFYSLEVSHDRYMQKAMESGMTHLIIQSKPRKDFLIGDRCITTSLVPNAPLVDPDLRPRTESGTRLVYFGNMSHLYALEDVVTALMFLPNYTLTLRGPDTRGYGSNLIATHRALVDSARLAADWTYLGGADISAYLRRFDIGIGLYDFRHVPRGDVNFLTSPSGKIYNYFNAAMPTVCIDIPGLSVVRDFNAGVLIPDTDPESIAAAVREVSGRYEEMSLGAVAAARASDFGAAFDGFLRTIGATT